MQLLLESLKGSLEQPFQRLPSVIAAFAAEACLVLVNPAYALYTPINKLLLRQPELNIQVSLDSGHTFRLDMYT